MNFSLGKKLEQYIKLQLENGSFNSASEIVRDALRMHQRSYLNLYREMITEEELRRWEQELGDSQIQETGKKKQSKG